MYKAGLVGLLILLWTSAAAAQTPCDRWSFATGTGATPITQFIAGVPGQRIYLCGHVLIASGNPLDFQLFSGTGTNCATEQTAMTPLLALPTGGMLVNRTPWVAEYTAAGHSLCFQTSGTGNITATLYWIQRP